MAGQRSRAISGLAGAVALVCCTLWWAWTTPTAWAHATYVRSDPPSGGQLAAPGTIRVIFTEDTDAGFSELQLLDAARRRVDLGDTRAVPNDPKSLNVSVPKLPDGTYALAWRTLSTVDGHTARGVFSLVVGTGGSADAIEMSEAPVLPAEVLLRATSFFGTLALVGGLVFAALVFGPSTQSSTHLPSRRPVDALQAAWRERFRRAGLLLLGLLLLVNLLWLALQVAAASDVPIWTIFGQPLGRWLGTRSGSIWLARLAMLAMLLGCFWLGPARWRIVAGLVLAGALLLLTSLTSHAAALSRGAELAVAADWLHQVGAAIWLGGLVAILLLIPEAVRAASADRLALLASVVPRFSVLAMAGAGLLVATGLVGALIQVGSLEALGTHYGWALLVKVAAVIPMLALGAFNLLIIKPRFREAAQQRAQLAADRVLRLTRRFRLAVAAEVVLGTVILLATGILTSAEPGREVWARHPKPIDLAGPADDLQVGVRIEPGRIGQNTFDLTVLDGVGNPAADVQRVQLRFVYLDQELGRGVATATPQGEGRYRVDSGGLNVVGRWQLEVAVRRLNREDSVAASRFDLGQAAAPGSGALPLPAFASPYVPLALALLLAASGGVIWSLTAPALRRSRRRGYAVACAIVALASGLQVARAANFGPDLRTLRNPLPASSASLARGQELYLRTGCAECHGETGRGDGPLGLALRPRPADFRIHMAAGHTDGELFDWISNGVPSTAMMPFRDQLSEEQRWDLINYIRGFAASGNAGVGELQTSQANE